MSTLSEKKIEKGLGQAKVMSSLSPFKQHHLGAVLYCKGKMIAQGYNTLKTSPVQKRLNRERDFNPDESGVNNTVHAEIACLLKTRETNIDYSKSVLYIYREHKSGVKAMARPCAGCMKAIKEYGIRTICYTTECGYCVERIDE